MRLRSDTETVQCPRCTVDYRPSLTGGTCPVCDTHPTGEHEAAAGGRDLLLPIVVAATVLNVVLLVVLAVAVSRVG